MALKLPYTLESDITLSDAYFKIVHFEGHVVTKTVDVLLALFKDESARRANKTPVSHVRVTTELNLDATGNVYQNLYSAIKKIPEYSNAEDV